MYRIGKEEIDAVTRVINSKELFKINSAGQEVMNCEKEAKALFGARHSLLLTSGKAALISALTAFGVGPGDEVIVPAYTYIASAIAVTAVGAIPVIADVDETLTLDAVDIERKISKYTKAVMPVHIQGFPCNMDAIMECAKRYSIKVVEDACQSVGGSYNKKRLGTIGDAGTLSFNYFKIITAGEGGMLFTNDDVVAERALIFHDSSAIAYFGNQLKDGGEEPFCGNEYRANEINAAILREQFKKLDGILYDLRKNKTVIIEGLKEEFKFIPSHDANGDCGTTVAFSFNSEVQARKFAESKDVYGTLPIDTGKHVYTHWTPIIEKRGAFHEGMDPFKMKVNEKLNHNYSADICTKTLEILSKTVYVYVNPDWNQMELKNLINACKNAKRGL